MTDEDVFYRTLDAFFKDADLQKARALAALADVSTEFKQLVFSPEGHPYRQDIDLRGSFLEAIVRKYGENSLEAKVEDAPEISFFEKAKSYAGPYYELGKKIARAVVFPLLPGIVREWINPEHVKKYGENYSIASMLYETASSSYAGVWLASYLGTGFFPKLIGGIMGFIIGSSLQSFKGHGTKPVNIGPTSVEIAFHLSAYRRYNKNA